MSSNLRMFGEVAYEKGYITTAQLYEALSIQARQEAQRMSRQFLGEILVEMDVLTEQQVLEILTDLHGDRNSARPESARS